MTVFRSLGVIIFAFMVNALLAILTDFLLESIGILPNPGEGLFETWAIILVLFYRGIYTLLAGYIIGKLAPNKPMFHAMILGATGIVITLLAINDPVFAEKSKPWFGYALIALTIPCLWLGVKIHKHWNKK